MTGVVVSWTRSWGLIRPDYPGDDVFCHFSGIVGTGFRRLHKGDVVEFELRQYRDRLNAVNVVVIESGV